MKHTSWLIAGIISLLLSCVMNCAVPVCSLPQLRLKCTHVEIQQGEYFDAGAYIAVSRSDTGRLILPDVDTSVIGKQAVIYRLVEKSYEVDQILIVDVKK